MSSNSLAIAGFKFSFAASRLRLSISSCVGLSSEEDRPKMSVSTPAKPSPFGSMRGGATETLPSSSLDITRTSFASSAAIVSGLWVVMMIWHLSSSVATSVHSRMRSRYVSCQAGFRWVSGSSSRNSASLPRETRINPRTINSCRSPSDRSLKLISPLSSFLRFTQTIISRNRSEMSAASSAANIS